MMQAFILLLIGEVGSDHKSSLKSLLDVFYARYELMSWKFSACDQITQSGR